MPVYLGLCDEPLHPSATFRDSQLGGHPLWLLPAQTPLCGECGARSCLVTQLYVPLEGSIYERVLYVFSCVKGKCQNKTGAWSVVRQMTRVQEVMHVVKKKVQEKMFEEDDWDTDGDEWEGDVLNFDGHNEQESVSPSHSDSMCKAMSSLTLHRSDGPGPVFAGYYLYVIPEPFPKESFMSEEELLDQAQAGGSKEKYESTEVSHKDKPFHKFYKKIQLSPDQCIRYDLKGTPLLSDQTIKIPQCEKCDKARQFEMQLMPALISILNLEGSASHPLDFRTVIVWTCQGDCVEGNVEVVECVAEPEIHLERLLGKDGGLVIDDAAGGG